MKFLIQHILHIISEYRNQMPLATHLKQYYKQFPKLGSRDRKAISEAVFGYYRYAKTSCYTQPIDVISQAVNQSSNEFLKKAIALNATTVGSQAPLLNPQWHSSILLSEGIASDDWLRSMQQQPDLFLRLRNSPEKALAALQKNDISFSKTNLTNSSKNHNCIRVHNSTNIALVLSPEDYVVQDAASQASIYIALNSLKTAPKSVWDVCSGAGGKSILIKDCYPQIELTATDIRNSILHNLRTRFKTYNLGKIKTLVVDSTNKDSLRESLGSKKFDLIICDVPCSGSGTWARTPEQFHFFEPEHLQKFETLQFPIANNAVSYLNPQGVLVYITCSVFQCENEQVVERLKNLHSLNVVHQQAINGINEKADCMFVSILQNTNEQ